MGECRKTEGVKRWREKEKWGRRQAGERSREREEKGER